MCLILLAINWMRKKMICMKDPRQLELFGLFESRFCTLECYMAKVREDTTRPTPGLDQVPEWSPESNSPSSSLHLATDLPRA